MAFPTRSLRALVTTAGTTGDVTPFLAVATALSERGHSVTLAVPANYKSCAAAIGVNYVECGPSVTAGNLRSTVSRLRHMTLERQIAHIATYMDATAEAAIKVLQYESENADVLVSAAHHRVARLVHLTTGVPLVLVRLAPPLPGERNSSRKTGARAQPQYQLDAMTRSSVYNSGKALTEVSILAVSRLLCESEDTSHLTPSGFIFFDEALALPAEISAFLAAGAPPLTFTFGSMVQEPSTIANLVSRAIERTGCRAILQFPLNADEARAVSRVHRKDLLICGSAPHHALFPRSCAVVHHAGAGTTAAVLRHGLPSLPVPHVLDQPYWADRLVALGCSPTAIPRNELTAECLSSALHQLLVNPRWRDAAQAAAQVIASERGLDVAREAIETLAKARP